MPGGTAAISEILSSPVTCRMVADATNCPELAWSSCVTMQSSFLELGSVSQSFTQGVAPLSAAGAAAAGAAAAGFGAGFGAGLATGAAAPESSVAPLPAAGF